MPVSAPAAQSMYSKTKWGTWRRAYWRIWGMVGNRRCSAVTFRRTGGAPGSVWVATIVLSSINRPLRLPSKMTERGRLEHERFAAMVDKTRARPIARDAAYCRDHGAGRSGRGHQGIPRPRRHRRHHLVVIAAGERGFN